ncbi:uncharacterized protein LOC121877691 [Homarus americanus]|uniref:Uncharacterized protein n=1 Tax=Homarus americanus TaxID=6706 RepID=A0A8J5JKG0_HOMAM|nr:uncharacterized protein LOC121877691 [Homarus americanus]KAG7159270.1 hypothetical protein Hamer_G025937 [Homarus americanus]
MEINSQHHGGRPEEISRILVTIFLAVVLIITVVLNGLAGPGASPFSQSTGDVSNQLFTCITPAGYTFIIWSIIYTALVLIVIYAISLLLLRVDGVKAWKHGGAVSFSFMLVLAVNLILNVGWLFAWDAVNATASFIILLLVAVTNIIAISLSAYSFARVASSLYQKSKFHFWSGILVINGMGLYVTWTIIAALLNVTIFFMYEVKVDSNGVCLGVLIFLLVSFIFWFILENAVFTVFANPLLTHYIVLLWAIVGVYVEQKDSVSTEVSALMVTIIAASSIMLVARVVILVYRNRNNATYSQPTTHNSVKVDACETQDRLY